MRRAARAIGGARALASFEDLGVQMNHHSTLVSYLHRLLILLDRQLRQAGDALRPDHDGATSRSGDAKRTSPVAGARIVGGLVPCNVIADEILTDHPKRYRAMLVEAANPAHSLADSQRMREALAALDTLVVIDVAMSETAQLAHYVLPAATPVREGRGDVLQLRLPGRTTSTCGRRLLPRRRARCSEAEIHARPRRGARRAHRGRPRAAARAAAGQVARRTRRRSSRG